MKSKDNIGSKLLLIFLAMATLLSVAFAARAQDKDDEESLIGKAASGLLDSMPDFFKDVAELQKMTEQEKVEYIRTKANERIREKVVDKFKEDMLKKVEEYAKEALRAKLFLEIGVPKIRHAYAMGEAFNWSLIDSEIASKLDTKMNALSAGIKTVQIGWAACEAYSEGDMLAAAKSIGGSIAGLLAEAYIPGWSYIKLGAAMVEALGKFVLSYATETALQGMLEDMYGMKKDPQGFAQWLIDKTPAQIEADIRNKWEWGAGYGRVWQGQGTDKGDEEMMNRIKSTVISLRGELLVKKREQKQKEQQVQRDIERYLAKSRDAEKEVREAAQKVKQEADRYLIQIEQFKTKVLKIKEEKAKEKIQKIEAEVAKEPATEISASVNPDEILSLWRLYYDEIKDTPGNNGYGYDKMSRYWGEASAKRYNNEKQAHQSIRDQYRTKYKQLSDQYGPPLTELYKRIEAARVSRSPQSLIAELQAQYDDINARYGEAQVKLGKAYAAAGKKLAGEIAILDQKLALEKIEARKRDEHMARLIKDGMGDISSGIRRANRELEERRLAWVSEVQGSIKLPALVLNERTNPEVYACAGICGPAREAEKTSRIQRVSPGDLYKSISQAHEMLEQLKRDLDVISTLFQKQKESYKKYQAEILNQRVQFNSLVPENLQVVPSEGIGVLQEVREGALKQMDERVEKGGVSSAGQESWGAGGVSVFGVDFVSYSFQTPPIEMPTKYFDRFIEELNNKKESALERYRKAIEFVKENISILDYYASLDAIALSINRIAPPVFEALRFYYQRPQFNTKNQVPGLDFPVSESDGAKYLAEMKKAWETNRPKVEKLQSLKKAYSKDISYISNDPAGLLKELDTYVAFPGRIAQYEKEMEEAEKKRLSRLEEAEKELKKFQDMLAELKAEPAGLKAAKTIAALKRQLPYYLKAPPGSNYYALRDKFLVFQKEFEEYLVERDRYLKELAERQKREQEAEARRAQEELRKKQEEAAREFAKAQPGGLAALYGYSILNPRLNTYSLSGAAGEVILMKNDLKQGAIEITGRLSTLDKVDKVLFSEDGGRTWKELARNQDIVYSFIPMPDKRYQPVLKIKTTGMEEMELNIFSNIEALLYRDIDYYQLIAETAKKIADAYEAQNLSVFSEYISRDYLGNKTFLEEGVRLDFDLFTDIRLVIYINRIEKRANLFVAETKWDKTQTPRKTGQQQRTTGRTTFMFVFEDGAMKVKNLRGNLIYATLSPEIAQASGLSSTIVNQIRTARDDRNPTQPGAGTTEDSGGVTSSSILTVSNGTVRSYTGPIARSFDFSSGTEGISGAGDIDFEANIFLTNGTAQMQDITGLYTFNGLTDAPVIVDEDGGPADVGTLLLFVTNEGYYGKMEVTSWTDDGAGTFTVQFRYAIQTDGSRNLQTQ